MVWSKVRMNLEEQLGLLWCERGMMKAPERDARMPSSYTNASDLANSTLASNRNQLIRDDKYSGLPAGRFVNQDLCFERNNQALYTSLIAMSDIFPPNRRPRARMNNGSLRRHEPHGESGAVGYGCSWTKG